MRNLLGGILLAILSIAVPATFDRQPNYLWILWIAVFLVGMALIVHYLISDSDEEPAIPAGGATQVISTSQTSFGDGVTNIQISNSNVGSLVSSPGVTAPMPHSMNDLNATFSYETGLLVIGISNVGPTIPDATLNMLVPVTLGSITAINPNTNQALPGSQLHTPELIGTVSSWFYWATTGLRLRKNIHHLLHFELGNLTPGTYPAVVRLIADELPDRAEIHGSFTIPDPDIEARVDELTRNESRGTAPVFEARRDVVKATLNSVEIRQVLNEQIADLTHQRETVWEWSELRRQGSGLNERFNWDHRKAVLHSYRQYASAFQATELAWGAIGRLDVPVAKQTNYHRENAMEKIDAALAALRQALDATP
jgi:hypothetical protein